MLLNEVNINCFGVLHSVENEMVTMESFDSACFHVFHNISIYSFPASVRTYADRSPNLH